jgi:hypothetical protein
MAQLRKKHGILRPFSNGSEISYPLVGEEQLSLFK